MKHDHLTTGALALLLTTSLVTAQRTWIVDGAKGPGYDFTELHPAIKAAKDGDRIVVRKGDYSGLCMANKGISILGEPGARLSTATCDAVAGLAAGKRFVLRGVKIVGYMPLIVRGCKGSVHILDVDFDIANPSAAFIGGCEAVTIDGCSFRPYWLRGAIDIDGSRVVLNRSRGGHLRADGSDVTLTACVLQGVWPGKHQSATPAITARDCRLMVHSGGYVGGGYMSAIVGTGGALTLDPRAHVNSAATGFTKITKRPLAALTAKGGKLGGSADLTLESRATMPFAVFGSLAARPLAKELDLWLDLRFLHLVATGVQGSTGRWTGKAAIPNLQVLRGLVLGYQAIEVDLKNPSLELSSPAFVAGH